MDNLTERQVAIYQYIRDYMAVHGYAPTVRDIGKAFGLRSINGALCHLKALERKGLIARGTRSARAIQLLQEPGTGTRLEAAEAALRNAGAVGTQEVRDIVSQYFGSIAS